MDKYANNSFDRSIRLSINISRDKSINNAIAQVQHMFRNHFNSLPRTADKSVDLWHRLVITIPETSVNSPTH